MRGWHSLHRRSPYLAVVEEVINHQRLKELLPLHRVDITEKLQRLCRDGILEAEGYGRGRVYHLKTVIGQTLQPQEVNLATSEGQTLQPQKGNLATSEGETLQPQEANLATSEGETLQPRPRKLDEEQRTKMICHYCVTWKNVHEIAEYLGRNKNYIRNSVLPALIKSGLLEMRYPTVENHPQQQYRTRETVTLQE